MTILVGQNGHFACLGQDKMVSPRPVKNGPNRLTAIDLWPVLSHLAELWSFGQNDQKIDRSKPVLAALVISGAPEMGPKWLFWPK